MSLGDERELVPLGAGFDVAKRGYSRAQVDEHRKVLEDARAQAKKITDEAEAERKRLDTESQERRTKVEEDFEIAMASRRTEAMRVLAEQEAASKAEAARRVQEATQDAADIRAKVLAEENAAKADIDRRQRESVAEANK